VKLVEAAPQTATTEAESQLLRMTILKEPFYFEQSQYVA